MEEEDGVKETQLDSSRDENGKKKDMDRPRGYNLLFSILFCLGSTARKNYNDVPVNMSSKRIKGYLMVSKKEKKKRKSTQ